MELISSENIFKKRLEFATGGNANNSSAIPVTMFLAVDEDGSKSCRGDIFLITNDAIKRCTVVEVTLKGFQVNTHSSMIGDLMCTGLTTWRVADITAKFISQRAVNFRDLQVLEVGSGLGFCGIAAAVSMSVLPDHHIGRVLLTDGDDETLLLCQENIQVNGVSAIASSCRLRWNDQYAARSLRLKHTGNRGFDVIIGSDCLYGRDLTVVHDLFSTVNELLAGAVSDHSCGCDDDIAAGDLPVHDEGIDIEEPMFTTSSPGGGGWNEVRLNSLTVGSTAPLQPVFLLGYERRLGGSSVGMSDVFSIASKYGLECAIAEDSVVDMFGNETSELTLFWEQCVFLFTRRIDFV